jgi:hypothetical protein
MSFKLSNFLSQSFEGEVGFTGSKGIQGVQGPVGFTGSKGVTPPPGKVIALAIVFG